ncbi:hypothetical protein [Ruminococcus flavefaciens]|uniref:hypothetical protein n=1 Tax=Ruminococcus flavefaciens TaxID=1265 RepID=UPI0004910616|nr:hypothetical protein [Ruminococcus flavefaciens]
MSELFTIILIAMPVTVPLMVIGLIKLSDSKKSGNNYPQSPYYYNNNFNQPYDYNNSSMPNSTTIYNTAGGFGTTPTPVPSVQKENNETHEKASAPQQTIQPEKPKKTKPDMTVSNILFLIGTIFVVLSGLAFGVAGWVKTSYTGRVLIIAAAAAVAYTLSGVISKFLKLTGTSISFYVLGTGFVSTALLTAGYYKLIGEWFSFDGDGTFALLTVSSFISAALMFVGEKLYKNIALVYASLITASIGLLFAVLQIADTYAYRSILFIIAQMIITAFIYIMRPFKGSKYETPVKNIGTGTAFTFGSIALTYTLSTLDSPAFASYFIIIAAIIQFVFYGIYKKMPAFIVIESVLSLMLAFMIHCSLLKEFNDDLCVTAVSLITIIIYLVHRFIPNIKNTFSEAITFSAVIFMTFSCIALIRSHTFAPYLLIAVIAAIIVASYLLSENSAIKSLAGTASPIIPLSAAIAVSTQRVISPDFYISTITCASMISVILMGFAAVMMFTAFGKKINSEAAVYSNLSAVGLVLLSTPQYKLLSLITAALCLVHFALSNKTRFNFAAIFSSLSLLKIVYMITKEYSGNTSVALETAMFITVIIYVLLSRMIYPDAFIYNKGDRKIVDPLITVAWIGVLKIFDYTDISTFLGLIACAVFCTGLIKKNFSDKAVSVLLTISTAFTVIALIDRPFFIFESKAVTNKITLAIIALSGLAIRFIWRKFETTAKNFSQIIFIFTFVSLLIDAIVFDTAANTIFVMTIMILVLIISIISRSKTWFITAAASLFTITVYATREYLMALNWWIYLFIAGVVLIGLASVNEYLKKNNETLKTSVAKRFSGWTW